MTLIRLFTELNANEVISLIAVLLALSILIFIIKFPFNKYK